MGEVGWRVIAPDGTVLASGPPIEMEAAGALGELLNTDDEE